MRYLIRLAKSRIDDWVNGVGSKDPQSLTNSVFQMAKAHRKELTGLVVDSTYLVEGHTEEARVAAAHLLAGPNPKLEARYLIRILVSDTVDVGFRLDDSSIGQTGVPWIDFRHRDLVGTKDQFRQLVEVTLGRLRSGEDMIRRIGSAQNEYSFNEFLARSVIEIPTCTRDLIACMLNGNTIAGLKPNIAASLAEMAVLVVPEECVSLRAFCLEEAGKGICSPDGNWDLATNQLREEYMQQYPHVKLVP